MTTPPHIVDPNFKDYRRARSNLCMHCRDMVLVLKIDMAFDMVSLERKDIIVPQGLSTSTREIQTIKRSKPTGAPNRIYILIAELQT